MEDRPNDSTAQAQSEYRDLTEDQKDDLRTYIDGLEVARDFCDPYFDRAVRWLKLLDGIRPPELNGSFAKIMLNIPFQIVQNEIPRAMRGVNAGDYFDLYPESIPLEEYADQAKKWLSFQMDVVQNMQVNLIPTFQYAYACGNGYRVYSHRYKDIMKTERVPDETAMGIPVSFRDEQQKSGTRSIISGQNAHFFSILPQPGGSLPNAFDDSTEDVIDGLHWITYMTKTKISENVKHHGWDSHMAKLLFESAGKTDNVDPAKDYVDQLPDKVKGGIYGGDPKWILNGRNKDNKNEKRFRVGWFFCRDRWIVVAEDTYLLWAGKPLINAIPVSNHRPIPMLNNWFGKSMIEVSEELIIAIMQNFNARMDYLAQTMHPSTYIPKRLLDHHQGDKSVFDPKPYNVIDVPHGIDASTDILHDRYPELPQQAFLEQNVMNQMIQKILGQPDLLSGQGSGSQADGSATGFMGLLSEGNIRMMQRALNVESTGIMDDLMLTLRYGSKYVDENVMVRMEGDGGSPWHEIAHMAITDGYGIRVSGTKSLDLKEETFRKMLSLAQFIVNNPMIESQKEFFRQVMNASGAFKNVEDIIGNVGAGADQSMASMMGGEQMQGGQGPMQNEIRSQANRNSVQANTGDLVPASELVI